MSESFEQLLNESFKTIRNGEVVKGTVIAVKDNEIVLNIGYKADGIIQKSEFNCEPQADLTELVHVGDELEAKIIQVNDGEGQVQLSTSLEGIDQIHDEGVLYCFKNVPLGSRVGRVLCVPNNGSLFQYFHCKYFS